MCPPSRSRLPKPGDTPACIDDGPAALDAAGTRIRLRTMESARGRALGIVG